MSIRIFRLTLLVALLLAACQPQTEPPAAPPTTTPTPGPEAPAATATATPEPEPTISREARFDTPPPATLPELVPTEAPLLPVTGEVPADLLAKMIADLAGRLGIAETEVSVVQAESVTWPDGAMGCPQPGMAYTQALVDGYRVVLLAAGESYPYHANDRGTFFLCEPPGIPGKPLPGLKPEQ